MMTPEQIIEKLNLEIHCEGAYFQRTFYSKKSVQTENQGERRQLSSIYYLLTSSCNISYFARNKSDLILYYHLGDPLKIIYLNEDGSVSEKILGPDIMSGQQLQLPCPANTCKAYELMGGNFCLIGEAVAPGFEYQDMEMPSYDTLMVKYPDAKTILEKYTNRNQ